MSSSEAERIAELITDFGQRLSTAFGDMIPPDASRHLRNAQREALTAVLLIYEDQLGRRTSAERWQDDEQWDRSFRPERERPNESRRGSRRGDREGDAPQVRPERDSSAPRASRTRAAGPARRRAVRRIDVD
jgi:hypothetical protein